MSWKYSFPDFVERKRLKKNIYTGLTIRNSRAEFELLGSGKGGNQLPVLLFEWKKEVLLYMGYAHRVEKLSNIFSFACLGLFFLFFIPPYSFSVTSVPCSLSLIPFLDSAFCSLSLSLSLILFLPMQYGSYTSSRTRGIGFRYKKIHFRYLAIITRGNLGLYALHFNVMVFVRASDLGWV